MQTLPRIIQNSKLKIQNCRRQQLKTQNSKFKTMEYTTLDTGNTAWMIVATILVLMMSIPGIALFYGGLVRQKNVLSVIMQTMLIVGVVSLILVAIGYSWAFGTGFKESGSCLWLSLIHI